MSQDISKVVEIAPVDEKWGIILENMEELENALKVYDKGIVQESRTTKEKGADDIIKDHGLPWLDSATESDFLKKILDEAKPELKTHGKYRNFFDYSAMGTRFFKTGVEIEKAGKEYVLGINAAWIGREPENALAKHLNKPIALRHSIANVKMDAINDLYFNLDLEDVLRDTSIPRSYVEKCAQTLFGKHEWIEPLSTTYKGEKFKLGINFRSANNKTLTYHKGRISGMIHDSEGMLILPVITLKLENDSKEPHLMYPPIVNPEKMQCMMQARDDLIEKIQSKK